MSLRLLLKLAVVPCVISGACLFAEDDAVRRPSIGLRFQYTQTRPFETFSTQASTTKPIADYNYSATSSSRGLELTPNLEYRLTSKLTLGLEFQFRHAQYRQLTEIRSGKKDPTLANDDRKVSTITETTKASYWEVPLLAHYYGITRSGPGAKVYLTGGVALRRVANIRTGTEYSNADGTTDYNEIPASPDRTNQLGLVAGIGYRIIDDFHIKWTPEVRITHWQGTTFQGPAFRSAANQLSVGLGVAF
jgi:hypothetical protein